MQNWDDEEEQKRIAQNSGYIAPEHSYRLMDGRHR